jgi:uncharacterized protein
MESTFNWSSGSLGEGMRCYCTGQFFAAHEHWETVWLTLREPEKSFLQALIQISAAFHHLGRGNRTGAISLLTRSLRRLDRCPSPYCSLDIEFLRQQVRRSLSALQVEQQEAPMSVPKFRIVDAPLRSMEQ